MYISPETFGKITAALVDLAAAETAKQRRHEKKMHKAAASAADANDLRDYLTKLAR